MVEILESYGYRVQKSVFEIEITESDFIKLKMKLEKILKKAELYYQENKMESNDSVKFYILCKT
ncbi:MAG: CRISPR-associated endonuclease Cas2 [Patescibacteria group bacterium]|nr:CRISPR-associated endonuclease Cas2 [Patescibacteria group bacterium]